MTRLRIYDPEMPDLILLNGPPASGKSTIAQRYIDARPLALNLDVDVIRHLLGGWAADPVAAGGTARSLALGMASQHLTAGFDVIVPQFLGRVGFIEKLAGAAATSGARFVEVALWLNRADAVAAFAERSEAPTTQAHRDAVELVARSSRPDPVGAMYDEFVGLVDARPQTIRVDAARGNIDFTFHRFCQALDAGTTR